MKSQTVLVFASLILISLVFGCVGTDNVQLRVDETHKMLFFGDTSIQLLSVNEQAKSANFKVESKVLPSKTYTFSVSGNDTVTVSAEGCSLLSVTLIDVTEEKVNIEIEKGDCIKSIIPKIGG